MKKIYEVVAAVIIKENKVFCAKRGPNKSLPYKWEFPGGKVEVNETQQTALTREIYEEFKSIIEVEDYIASNRHEYDTFIITLHAYFCKLIDGNMELSEHVDKKWVEVKDLELLDWADADIPIVKKIVDILK